MDSKQQSRPEDILPVDEESEHNLIACLIVDSRRYHEVCKDVGPQDFFFPDHREVYECIGKLVSSCAVDQRPRNNRCPLDVKVIADELKASFSGRVRIANYAAAIGTGYDFLYYARRIRECSRRRAIALAGQDMVRDACAGHQSVDDLTTLVLRRASELGVGAGTNSQVSTIGEVIRRELLPKIENDIYGTANDEDFISTGWNSLDCQLGRLHRGSLVVIAGRPGQGKTSLAANIAASQAFDEGRRVLFVTLEQPQREIADMVWRARAGVGSIASTNSTSEKKLRLDRMLEQSDVVNSESLLLMEGGRVTVESIAAACRLQSITLGVDLVLVDYLGCIEKPKGNQLETYKIQHITQSLKILAKQLRVPVILLCQLNRQFDKEKENSEPHLHHLKDSSSIEADADQVLFVWRPGNGSDAKVKIAKNRHGILGVLEFDFIGDCKRFVEKYQPQINPELAAYNQFGVAK